jgi:exonuclease SbcD
MRLLHTSDWHLGRALHGLDLIDAQRAALQHITEVARRERVAAVLISGDVYDRAVPPIEAVELFHETLRELTSFTTVIVSSGNHDSAIRLGFGSGLFTDVLHVRTRTLPDSIAAPVELQDEHGPVLVFAIPYLDPDVARDALAESDRLDRSHHAVMSAATALVRAAVEKREADLGTPVRSVVLAHAFVGGIAPPEHCESERDITVGGVAMVSSDVFSSFTYTALGHLHGPQEPRVDGPALVRYSGSPLRYSFSEAGHTKSVTLVELGPDGVDDVRAVEVPQPRPMAQIVGPIDQLLSPDEHGQHHESWVKAVVTDPVRPELMNDRLRERFPHLLCAHHVPALAGLDLSRVGPGAVVDPIDVVLQFVADATGENASDAVIDLVRSTYEQLRREEEVA